jgi:peptide-methionine (S)-S-oxide reductase
MMLPAWSFRRRIRGIAVVGLLFAPLDSAGHLRSTRGEASATTVLAGGCYWGVEAVFEHLQGVQSVTSGFARYEGALPAPGLPVSVEAVRIVYDPSRITYRQLLEVFFLVAHDPTSRDRQGPDAGPEYRAVVLFDSPRERAAAENFVAELDRGRRFSRPIVTEIRALAGFEIAAADQQDYGARHPSDPYIVRNDAPKLINLKRAFPALYRDQRAP